MTLFGSEPAPAVWGVGRLVVDGSVTPWPVSQRDIDDEAVAAVATADEVAWRALVDAGLAPRRWAKVGPTSALECARRSGLHLDGERWEVDVADGEVVVTNRAARLTPCVRLHAGFAGSIADEP